MHYPMRISFRERGATCLCSNVQTFLRRTGAISVWTFTRLSSLLWSSVAVGGYTFNNASCFLSQLTNQVYISSPSLWVLRYHQHYLLLFVFSSRIFAFTTAPQVASLLREHESAKTQAGLTAGDLQQRLVEAQRLLDRERDTSAERKVLLFRKDSHETGEVEGGTHNLQATVARPLTTPPREEDGAFLPSPTLLR